MVDGVETKLNHNLKEQFAKMSLLERKWVENHKWRESERAGTSTIILIGERFQIIVIHMSFEEGLNAQKSCAWRKTT